MTIKIVGKKKAVQSALTRMLREEWAMRRITCADIDPYQYLAVAMRYAAAAPVRMQRDSLSHVRTKRAARWAGRKGTNL